MKNTQGSIQASFTYDADILRGGHVEITHTIVEFDSARYSINKYPYNSVPLIEVTDFQTGRTSISSGVVVGPHTILTASHSFFPAGQRGDDVDIFMRYNDNHYPNPNSSGNVKGKMDWHYFNVGQDGTLNKSESQWDYAVINTAHRFSGWFGMSTEYQGGRVHMTGYPQTLHGVQQDKRGNVDQDSNFDVLNYLNFNAIPGNSGGPIWVDKNPGAGVSPYVVGICSTTDFAALLTNEALRQIKQWVRQDGYALGGRNASDDDGPSYRHRGDPTADMVSHSRRDELHFARAAASDDDVREIDLPQGAMQDDLASLLAGF